MALEFRSDTSIAAQIDSKYLWALNVSNIIAEFFGTIYTPSVDDSSIPTEFALKQNYPNPFNPSTIIEYDLPRAQNVIITIYDIRGRVVEKLVNEYKPAGRHSVEFYADNLASGVYFYRIQTDEFTRLHKMMLLK